MYLFGINGLIATLQCTFFSGQKVLLATRCSQLPKETVIPGTVLNFLTVE